MTTTMRRTATYGATPRSSENGANETTNGRGEGEGRRARGFAFGRYASAGIALAIVGSCAIGAMVYTRGVTDTIGVVQRALGTAQREITFRVHVCGVPQAVWDGHVPWPVCRVKLVGCPGGGRSCYHWRYQEGIEMIPDTAQRNSFTITTSAYGTGDVYGFSVIEAGCNVKDEQDCEKDDLGECKNANICDHRYDSGTVHATDLSTKTNNITCWEGDRCSSKTPFAHPIRWHKPGGHECFTLMGEWWNRVVPVTSQRLEYVWGTCDQRPKNPEVCANREAPSVCTLLAETKEQVIVAPTNYCKPNGVNAPDGTACRIKHEEVGIESMFVESSCCNGVCCPVGQICSRDSQSCQPKAPTIVAKEGVCPDPEHEGISGVCTQSCGSGNGDCDLTCAAAREDGATLSCTPGDANHKCICSNVGGHTANECKTSENPGWKCCTCKSIRNGDDDEELEYDPESGEYRPRGSSPNAPGRNNNVVRRR